MDENCENGLCTLKGQLLDHAVDDVELFGCSQVLNVSSLGRSTVCIKRTYKTISQWRSLDMVEAAEDTNTREQEGLRRTEGIFNAELYLEAGSSIHTQKKSCYLFRDGEGNAQFLTKWSGQKGLCWCIWCHCISILDSISKHLSRIPNRPMQRGPLYNHGSTLDRNIDMWILKKEFVFGGLTILL